jgi:hypothetical protein
MSQSHRLNFCLKMRLFHPPHATSLSEVAQQLKSLYSTQLGAAVKVHPNSGAVPAGTHTRTRTGDQR